MHVKGSCARCPEPGLSAGVYGPDPVTEILPVG